MNILNSLLQRRVAMNYFQLKFFLIVFIFSISYFYVYTQNTRPILLTDPQTHTALINDIVVSHDNKIVYTSSADKTLRLWDAESGKLIKTLRFQLSEEIEGCVTSLAMSPDGKVLVTSVGSGFSDVASWVYFLNPLSGEVLSAQEANLGMAYGLTFSADGSYLASMSESSNILLFKLPENLQKNNSKIRTLKLDISDTVSVTNISFTSDSKSLLASYADGKLRLWDIQASNTPAAVTGKIIYNANNYIYASCTKDGMILTTGANKEMNVLSMEGKLKKKVGSWKGTYFYSFVFSDDGQFVFVSTENDSCQQIIDLKNEVFESFIFRKNNLTTATCFFHQNPSVITEKMIVLADVDGNILFINQKTKKIIKKIQGAVNVNNCLGVNNKGVFAFGKAEVPGYNAEFPRYQFAFDFQNIELKKLQGKNDSIIKNYLSTRWYFDKKSLSFITNSQILLPSGKKIEIPYAGYAHCYSFGKNGDVLLGLNPVIFCYDSIGNFKYYYQGHSAPAVNMAISENDKYFGSVSSDGTIKIWPLNVEKVNFRVTRIVKGSLAEKSGLLAGDEILSVDGLHFSSSDELAEKTKQNKKYTYEILRNDKILKIELERKDGPFGFITSGSVEPLITLYVGPDMEWVCYTPSGYFSCSQEGAKYIVWHVNNGLGKLGTDYSADQLYDKFYRPDVVKEVFRSGLSDYNVLKKMGEKQQKIDKSLTGIPLVNVIPPTASTPKEVVKDGVKMIKYETSKQQIEIAVEVTDQGGGIDEVLLYHNGKALVTAKRGFKEVVKEDNKATYNFKISLLNGENQVKVVAFNKERTESLPSQIIIDYKGIVAESKLYLLAIGINQYINPKYKLNYAVPDQEAFVKNMTENAKSIFTDIDKVSILNAEATKPAILKAFEDIAAKIQPQDVFVFYFAGHGVMSEGTDTTKGDFYLVPSDVSQLYANQQMLANKAISSKELNDRLIKIKAQKQLVIIDACQSGGVLDEIASRGAPEEKAIVQLARSAGVTVLAAAGIDQSAGEFEQLGHGVFTYALLEGIAGKADGGIMDGKITVYELRAWLDEQVPELTKKYHGEAQYPTGYSKGQDFPVKVIVRK